MSQDEKNARRWFAKNGFYVCPDMLALKIEQAQLERQLAAVTDTEIALTLQARLDFILKRQAQFVANERRRQAGKPAQREEDMDAEPIYAHPFGGLKENQQSTYPGAIGAGRYPGQRRKRGKWLQPRKRASTAEERSRWRKSNRAHYLSAVLKREILKRQDHKCLYCGEALVEIEFDHFKPRCHGGSSGPENRVASCRLCNAIKGEKLFATIDAARGFIVPVRDLAQKLGLHPQSAMFLSRPDVRARYDYARDGNIKLIRALVLGALDVLEKSGLDEFLKAIKFTTEIIATLNEENDFLGGRMATDEQIAAMKSLTHSRDGANVPPCSQAAKL